MHYKESWSRKTFHIMNTTVLTLITLMGIVPFIHLLAVSLSSNSAAMAGAVTLWPKEWTFDAYRYLGQNAEFFRSLGISVQRVLLGTIINMLLVVMTAYPLSKENKKFRLRTVYVWYFAITMFFGGGLIPTYIVGKETALLDTIWAVVLPGALNVWYTVMLLNFFRGVPKDMEEAAIIDGAGHFRLIWSIYLPVSLPAIATIVLFTVVGHWNAWFDGILYMNSPANYPLQSYLSTLITAINMKAISIDSLSLLQNMGEVNLRTAQIFMGALPIMIVYPFLQKYFIKGIVIGSVKE